MTIFEIGFMALLTLNSFYIWLLIDHKNKVNDRLETYRTILNKHEYTIKELSGELDDLEKELENDGKFAMETVELLNDRIKSLEYKNNYLPIPSGPRGMN